MGVRATKYNQPQGYSDLENRALKDSAIHTNSIREVSVISASGGDVDALQPGNGYTYHTFTTSGTFTVANPNLTEIEILIVGAGGQGGGPMGGGGGAGELLHGTYTVSPGDYTVSIGSSTLGSLNAVGLGQTGSNSEFFPTPVAPNPTHPTRATAIGGGGGGSYYNSYGGGNIAGSGGSGGGTGGGYAPVPSAGLQGLSNASPKAGLTAYGFPGGTGAGAPYSASGGGGAGAIGGAGSPIGAIGGDGGPGRQYPQFASDLINLPYIAPAQSFFAAGGGGSGYSAADPGAPGYNPNREFSRGGNPNADELTGVGGAGHNNISPPSTPFGYGPGVGPTAPDKLRLHVYALDHTGSGGGGGSYSYGQPGQGGSGICCIRYLTLNI